MTANPLHPFTERHPMSTPRLVLCSLLLAIAMIGIVGLSGCDKSEPAAQSHDHADHDHADHDHGEPTAEPVAGVPADYPLKVCVVSGEDLGSMGKPVKVEHEGTAAYLCCEHCIDKFNTEPTKYLAKLTPAPAE